MFREYQNRILREYLRVWVSVGGSSHATYLVGVRDVGVVPVVPVGVRAGHEDGVVVGARSGQGQGGQRG
jgi:hypothetical protein